VKVRVLEFPVVVEREVGGLLVDSGPSVEMLHVPLLPDVERVDAIGSYGDAAGKAVPRCLVW
jgi:hypothetical protein